MDLALRMAEVDLKQYPNVLRWYATIAKRPAVQKGYNVPKDMGADPDAVTRDNGRFTRHLSAGLR